MGFERSVMSEKRESESGFPKAGEPRDKAGQCLRQEAAAAISFGLDNLDHEALRQEAEKALRESEARFRQLFDNMADGVAIYRAVDDGRDFVIAEFNEAGEKLSQARREDIVGKRDRKSVV